jgi:ubiquinone/menaquinone biosynthesis C-methylase UbiE
MSSSPTADTYNKIAADFSRTRRAPWPEFAVFETYLTNLPKKSKVLDLGCGNGRAKNIFTGMDCEYTGLDNSEELIKEARKLHPKDIFLPGNMTSLPSPDRSQNIVTAIASFHHLPDIVSRRQTLQEIRRVLAPGGYVFMTNWHLWQTRYWRQIARALLAGRPRELYIPWKDSGGEIVAERYYHAFTRRELARLFTAGGFMIDYQAIHRHNIVSVLHAV